MIIILTLLNEWAVAYHGIGGIRGYGDVFKNAVSIIKENLKPGSRQYYADEDNIREETKKLGKIKCQNGVYLTPVIKEAELYADEGEFKGKKFQMIMMCRVNPKKIREPYREGDAYWILDGNYNEIRPYRILIKEKN